MRLAAALITFALPALAQTGEEDALAAAAQLREARELLDAAQGRGDRIDALTDTVTAYEAGLIAMREGLRQIALREAVLSSDLAERRAELAQLLGILSTIERTPRPVLNARPDDALDAMRAAMMVSDVADGLRAEAAKLQAQLEEAQRLRAARETATQNLIDGLQGAQSARTALGQAISNRSDLPKRFDEDPVETALLAANAETLAGFADELASGRPDPDATLRPTASLALPVTGVVQPNSRRARPGVSIATEPNALVSAPVGATVLFQGPLLDYGNVIILEPAPDVLFVFAGLDQVFIKAGEIVASGAPIGLMGGAEAGVDGNLTQNAAFVDGRGQQTLYLEVRDGQSPTNPDAWFALE